VRGEDTNIASGEVTTLQHELGDNTVEGRASISESILSRAELTEVARGLGDNIVEELEYDTARRLCSGS
jgi:hypothetical protein